MNIVNVIYKHGEGDGKDSVQKEPWGKGEEADGKILFGH